MANLKISELSKLQTVTGNESIPVVSDGANYKIDVNQVLGELPGKVSNLETNKADKSELGQYLTKTEAGNTYVTSTELSEKVTEAVSGGNITLDGYAKEQWVEDKNYLTEGDIEGVYAKKSDLPKDTFLNGVTYNKNTQEIEFTFNTESGKEAIKANVGDLVDTYTNGEGLKLEGNEFSINTDVVATKEYVTNQDYVTNTALTGKNYATTSQVGAKADSSEITRLEGLINGKQAAGDYALKSDVNAKQDTLVSGTNIKTVNGTTLLGSGNVAVGDVTSSANLTADTIVVGNGNKTVKTTTVKVADLATASSVNGAISEADYNTGANSVTSLVSVPTNKRLCVITVGAAASLSLDGTVAEGRELHMIIKNTSGSTISVTIPNTFESTIGDTFDVEAESFGEINIISDGSTMYLRAV